MGEIVIALLSYVLALCLYRYGYHMGRASAFNEVHKMIRKQRNAL